MQHKVYTKDEGERGATETITQKALRLFRDGRVRREHGDVYSVHGDTGTYRVDLYRDGCSCAAGEHGQACSHVAAAEIVRAKMDAATARRLEALRAKKPERMRFSTEQVARNIDRMGGAA